MRTSSVTADAGKLRRRLDAEVLSLIARGAGVAALTPKSCH